MVKIKPHCRVTEINDAARTILSDFDANSDLAKMPLLPSIITDLRSSNERLTFAINKDKFFSETDKADSWRDSAVRDLGTFIAGQAVLKNEEKRNAALSLKAIFDKYGKRITLSSNEQETSLIVSMLEDFEAQKDSFALLDGLEDLIKDLTDAQKAFDDASKNYRDSKANKGESATSAKKDVLSIINLRLVPFLNSVSQDENSKDFSSKVEIVIEKVNSLVSAHSTSNKKKI